MKSLRDPKRRPTHPGAVLRDDVLPGLGMTQEAFADAIGVHRVTLSGLLRERRGLTVELAARIAKEAVDLWALRQQPERLAAVRQIKPRRRAVEAAAA
jgi:addiction module HigA family antidote